MDDSSFLNYLPYFKTIRPAGYGKKFQFYKKQPRRRALARVNMNTIVDLKYLKLYNTTRLISLA
jgi:hypothetical protein